MKHTILLSLGLALATFSHQVAAETPQSQASSTSLPPSTVVATVNETAITFGDLSNEMNRPDLKAAVQALSEQPAELEKLRKTVLSSLIDKQLLIKAAKGAPSYQPEEIKKEVDTIINEQGGQSVIQPILTTYGTSWDAFVQDMSERLTIEKFIEKDLLGSINITDQQLQSTFKENPSLYAEPETVSARHILVLVKPQASAADQKAALEKIQTIRKRVTAPGADFAAIASETSDDTASKVDGGNLGVFQRGMMVPEFEKAAFSLKVGEISEPIKTEYGYHIIKVDEHHQAEAPNFERAKNKVRYQVMAKTHDKVISEKLAQLRSQAKIDYKVAALKLS
jgi:peptidyl-prolyl cis-trans isomerase C